MLSKDTSDGRARRLLCVAALAAGVLALALAMAKDSSRAASPTAQADLDVDISDSPDPVSLNAPLSYAIRVTNWGPNPADGVTVVDKLPRGYLPSGATVSEGSCKVTGATVTCKLGTIGVGTAATVPVVTITGSVSKPGKIADSAGVSSRTYDPVSANNLEVERTRVWRRRHTPTCAGVPATIVGTMGDDLLIGTRGNDVVVARGGNDEIRTFRGEDIVCAGSGRDVVKAGIWRDRVFGGPGRDWILGGGGRDRLVGNAGRDRLVGGRGADLLLGGAGFDVCRGNRGVDRARGCERERL
ncbi:MAG: hypothetical protein AB7V58_12680 [Solirubrobacterales bacterium]